MTCHSSRTECRKFGKRKNRQRYQCTQCRKVFTDARDSTLDGMYLPVDKAELVLRLLLEGNSVSSVVRLTDVHKGTMKLLVLAGEKCERIMGERIRNVPVNDIQCDEMWGFIQKKGGHKRPSEANDDSKGDCYTYVAIERHTKLVLNIAMGRRDQATTDIFIEGLRAATSPQQFQITTDGFVPHISAITTTLHDRCDYAQHIKVYGAAQDGEKRYSPAEVLTAEKVPVMRRPERKRICTSHARRPQSQRRIIERMASFSRRNLFTSVAGALSLKGADTPKGQHSLKTIGVQLYTVRDVLAKDPEPVLKKIDQIGYREAEVVWASLEKVWPYLKQTRLKPVSVHLDSALFKAENSAKLSAAIEDVKGRGFEYAVYPYLPPPERGGLDKIRALAETLNRAGAECRKAGLKLCYHNHAFEFQPMESTTPFEVLLAQTDKDLVGLEMDIFWVSVGGHDPIEMLQKYSGRVPLLHVKNKAKDVAVQYNESVPKTAFKEAPNGVLDIPAILRAALDAGVQHYFVEQDATPGDPIESLRQSYDYLHRLKF